MAEALGSHRAQRGAIPEASVEFAEAGQTRLSSL